MMWSVLSEIVIISSPTRRAVIWRETERDREGGGERESE